MSGFVDANTLPGGARLSPAVCVVGSGAGGAVTAAVLAGAGHEVLVVEEGPYRTRADFDMREDTAYPWLYQDGGLRATKDASIAILQGRSVGGSTTVNWTTSFRTPERTLDAWRTRYGVPWGTAELAPHWDAVEERLSIQDWTLAAANPNNRRLYDGMKALGLDPHPTRGNVKKRACLGYCGMGCPTDNKQAMHVTYLPDAIAHGATVMHRLRVDRFVLEAGAVARAECTVLGADARTPTGRRATIAAKRFVLAGGAINSPGVLLRSGMVGPVGKRTFVHPVVGVVARWSDEIEPYFGPPQSVACHSLADRGDKIGVFFETAPFHPVLAALASTGFGAQHAQLMASLPHLTAHIALCIDGFHPSEPGGSVELRASGAPVLDYPIVPRVWEGLREGARTLLRASLAAGAVEAYTGHDPPGIFRSVDEIARLDGMPFQPGRIALFSAHLMGGCAMGSDRDVSVVRPDDLRAHTARNLHVIDGSVFPTSLGVNPQETIFGMARMVATRLASAWRA